MTDLLTLTEQIKQLSAESRVQLADYIAFLQWREQNRESNRIKGWSFSFIETFKEASVHASDEPAGMDVDMGVTAVGGERRPALWAHPPVTGQAIIEYYVPIPAMIRNIQLTLAIGVRDGAQIAEDNLIAFGVKVNGMRVWGQQSNEQAWQDQQIPLKVIPGDVARFEFTTEALGSHEWTWAVWGNPELKGQIESP